MIVKIRTFQSYRIPKLPEKPHATLMEARQEYACRGLAASQKYKRKAHVKVVEGVKPLLAVIKQARQEGKSPREVLEIGVDWVQETAGLQVALIGRAKLKEAKFRVVAGAYRCSNAPDNLPLPKGYWEGEGKLAKNSEFNKVYAQLQEAKTKLRELTGLDMERPSITLVPPDPLDAKETDPAKVDWHFWEEFTLAGALVHEFAHHLQDLAGFRMLRDLDLSKKRDRTYLMQNHATQNSQLEDGANKAIIEAGGLTEIEEGWLAYTVLNRYRGYTVVG